MRTASLLSLITKLTVCFHIAVSKYRNVGLNRRDPVFTADCLSFTRLNLSTGLSWQLRNRAERNCRGKSIDEKRVLFSTSRATDKDKFELSSRWEAKLKPSRWHWLNALTTAWSCYYSWQARLCLMVNKTTQHNTTQHITTQQRHDTIRNDTKRHDTTPNTTLKTTQHNNDTTQHNTTQQKTTTRHDTTRHDTKQLNTTTRNSTTQHNKTWHSTN